MKAYATAAEYEVFSGQTAPTDFDRLAMRASELIDNTVTEWFHCDDIDQLPTDPNTAKAMSDACCAQVEFWKEVGESNDVDGLAGTEVQTGQYKGNRAPLLSPRAVRILQNRELINGRGWIL